MLPAKLRDILEHEGVVAIATQGSDGPHLVNTWNSYVQITAAETLLIPVGGMNTTEANLQQDPRVLLTAGSRDVDGLKGPGAGFLITGTGVIAASGVGYDAVKARFDWARAALEITIDSVEQTI